MKPFHIYNSLSRSVEEFHPQNPPDVSLYSCGPTVYLPPHLGNMRAYLFVDTLRRALKFNGYRVCHVMNVTDVGHMTDDADSGEDKIEKTARAEHKSPREIADHYLGLFIRDMDALKIQRPNVTSRATDHIPEMIALTERIIANGYAYVTSSGVYFDVEKWRGPDKMGRLSRQSLDEQASAQRLEHSPDKKSPHDFALWMLAKPGHLMQWDSPWGRGYPGWHIECSAMSMKYLGDTIDIHTGGTDHIPVHHENEIAQSESATGRPFARYFIHNAFLVERAGTKISKSSGKFPVLDDIIGAGLNPMAFRLLCFGAKYRSELVLSDGIQAAQKNYDYITEFVRGMRDDAAQATEDSGWANEYRERFTDAINNDLNTPQALAVVLDLIAESYRRDDHRIWNILRALDSVIGLDVDAIRKVSQASRKAEFPSDIAKLIEDRAAARRDKNFKRSDELRAELEQRGYDVRDTREGSSYVPRAS
ncbi:MAG TPA: cysteine--tRNA ligase [Candidatus Binataceae bacterium]|nr:cysteine--tRNA ligase [Candidatus Binataceae bacterium]